jgi:3-hydroxybutyryl-CoA dehydrogenase
MSSYSVLHVGDSRSFPDEHGLLAKASRRGEVAIVIGDRIEEALERLGDRGRYAAVVVELGCECLGVYTGEARGEEGSNMLGFARFRLGDDPPSNLVELVRQPRTPQSAIDAAKQVFESAGLKVAVCNDAPGRIIDRLVRPYYNAALRRLDEGLATASDMDTTLKLGLGYPQGPIALLERSGLAHHFDVTQALYEAYGDGAYAPARRARVARQRADLAASAAALGERKRTETND